MGRHAGQLLEDVSIERITDELTKLMLTPDPARGIDLLVQTGVAGRILPEVPQLRLEADEHFRHKDVYQHSLTVLRQAIGLEERYGLHGDLVLRLAALLHDIGKPRTRSKLPDGRVAFHHHEVVGAKMARRRLTALRFPKDVVADVSELVKLHLRFHGYGDAGWTDSAVRRYVRDAELARLRPELNGNDIMRILGIPGGPLVGKAYNFLLELRIDQGLIGPERATQELLRWAEAEGLSVPPQDGEDGDGGPGGSGS
jgi:poly(A) polymerase